MKGILKLAYKLLANDKAKFTALLVGITFASFSMIFISAMFIGVMNHSSATIINIGASIWVMDPTVQIPANSIGMPDYVLDAVRSMQGVAYAVPLYSGTALVKLSNGDYQAANVMGLDDTSLLGRPDMVNGKITDVYDETVANYRQTVLIAQQNSLRANYVQIGIQAGPVPRRRFLEASTRRLDRSVLLLEVL